jgi:signal transduction histidine kinase
MQVRDNGVGIPVEMTGRVSSLGLLGMIERAEAIGGTFCVQRHPNGGTLATVTIPRPSGSESRHAARSDR